MSNSIRPRVLSFGLATGVIIMAAGPLLAQELRTLSNGKVADAEDLNHNFSELSTAISASADIGQFDPGRHVILNETSLETTPCTDDNALVRVRLDGTRATNEFVVPAGFTLFVTDVSWEVAGDFTLNSGSVLSMEITTKQPNGNLSARVYRSPRIEITDANANGILGASESLTSGFPVAEGRILCPLLWARTRIVTQRPGLGATVLHGFLVPDS